MISFSWYPPGEPLWIRALCYCALAWVVWASCSAQTFTNPVLSSQDPWVTFDNGVYYYSESNCGLADICVVSSPTLTGLATAREVGVWHAPNGGPNGREIWSPEIHKVNGHWYIYYAADDGSNDNHRLFILRADSSNPLGTYSMANTGLPNGRIV
jgi:GH43 family beta-xylosidase